MKIWIDAQLSPVIASWLSKEFDCDAIAIRELGLRDAEDVEIFEAAKNVDSVVITKDRDFVLLLDRFGPPPQIIWPTCGNTSNQVLKRIFQETFAAALALIEAGEPVVEINSPY